jgi:hypothetical protein
MSEFNEKRFQELAAKWKGDFSLSCSSNPNDCLKNEAFKEIIAAGSAATPLILKDYEATDCMEWAVALGQIVGFSPVKPESRGKSDLVRKDWLEWGRGKGLV